MALPATTPMWIMLNKGKIFSYMVANRQNSDFFHSRSTADHLLQGSKSIATPTVLTQVDHFVKNYQSSGQGNSKNYLNTFVDNFTQWLSLTDLKNYDADFSNGTTQAFDSFYLRHRNKRFRCYSGEYFYHLKTWQSNGVDWSFITDCDPLMPGDAVVLSVPFCDTGNVQHMDIISQCDLLNIPVLLDMCYYPLCESFSIDLSSNAIDTVCFSLSKIFPVAHHRIGVRYTKKTVFDGQKLCHSTGYANVLSAHIGQCLIDKYQTDHVYQTYRRQQQTACDFFGLQPSQSVIFALGNSHWNMYNRSNLIKEYQLALDPLMFCNRICLVPVYENWDLFERFMNAY